jgi:hypothetical protein
VELTAYIVEKLAGDKWQKVATVEPSVTLFCVDNLKEANEYTFRVSAENEVGTGPPGVTARVMLKAHAREYKTLSGSVPIVMAKS